MANKVILTGNVGSDPEIRVVDGDNKVAKFSLATTTRGYTRKDGSKVDDRTEWHRLVVWRGLAKVVEAYVKKGSKLYVEGEIRYGSYDNKDGVKTYTTDIFVNNMEMLGSKAETQQQTQQPQAAQNEVSQAGTNEDLPF